MGLVQRLIHEDDRHMYQLRMRRHREKWVRLFEEQCVITGDFCQGEYNYFGLEKGFINPTPHQYAIIYHKPRALSALLNIYCNKQLDKDPFEDAKEIPGLDFPIEDVYDNFSSYNFTNTRIPLLHLAVLADDFDCFGVLMQYLKKNTSPKFIKRLLNYSSNEIPLILNVAIKVQGQNPKKFKNRDFVEELCKNGADVLLLSDSTNIECLKNDESKWQVENACPLYYALKFYPAVVSSFFSFYNSREWIEEEENFSSALKNNNILEKFPNVYEKIATNRAKNLFISIPPRPKKTVNEINT